MRPHSGPGTCPARNGSAKLVSSGFLAIAYGSVGLSFAGFAVGLRGDSGDTTRDFSTALLNTPFGLPVLVALGLTIMGVGVYFVVKGLRRGFKEELFHFDGTRRGRLIDSLGVTGHVAKGIALNLAGLLFVIAAAKHSPGRIHRAGREPEGAPGPPVWPVPARRNRGRFHLLRRLRAGPCPVRPDVTPVRTTERKESHVNRFPHI